MTVYNKGCEILQKDTLQECKDNKWNMKCHAENVKCCPLRKKHKQFMTI